MLGEPRRLKVKAPIPAASACWHGVGSGRRGRSMSTWGGDSVHGMVAQMWMITGGGHSEVKHGS